jgi:hypothetical protein
VINGGPGVYLMFSYAPEAVVCRKSARVQAVFLLLARAPIPMLSLCGHRQSDERPLRADCVEKSLFADDRKFSAPLVHLGRLDARDHSDHHKNYC